MLRHMPSVALFCLFYSVLSPVTYPIPCRVFEKEGSKVVTDTVSLEFLKGAKVEYEDSLMRSAFVIAANPNSEASCGCGSSFTAKMN